MSRARSPLAAAGFLTLALLAAAAVSQEPKKAEPVPKKDPQQAVEPKSAPGEGQKFLAKFVGDWAVAKTFYPRDGGEPRATKGTCKQEMTHGGRFLRSEFEFEADAGKSTGTGVIGFEPETGLFTSTWVDSRQTQMSFRKSREKFAGEKIELFGAVLGAEPTARKSKTVTTLEDEGKKIIHRQYSIGTDGMERLMMELVLTKQAK
ncbi:DUF1579 domain-containing protein [Gemmata sp. JC717]|uniref:DUF1579 domain-containing protein n=1 Tax=Gemmata algarum TaxID=2975278 RepID=UPI0021BBA07E|nr:DUF1579 domain-containing protein [Gemmata algarum]MDY3551957.1 DUF1579 domain-containing protein [Gemmata algarum]